MQNIIVVGSDEGSYSVGNGTREITLTGLSYTPTTEQIAYVFNITQNKLYHSPVKGLAKSTIAGGVITYAATITELLVTGDIIHIQLYIPARGWLAGVWAWAVSIVNTNYAHYTSVEEITSSNIGLDGKHDGGDAESLFDDTSETYTAEDVAEGFTIYNITDGSDATVDVDSQIGYAGDGGAGWDSGAGPAAADPSMISHDALANGTDDDWDDDDVAGIPQCVRNILPTEGYNLNGSTIILDSQDAHNSCYTKLYATHNEDATVTDDIYWEDITEEAFGVVTVTADGIGEAVRTVTQKTCIMDTPSTWLKYMVKFVAECNDTTGDVVNWDNEFKFLWKKSS